MVHVVKSSKRLMEERDVENRREGEEKTEKAIEGKVELEIQRD